MKSVADQLRRDQIAERSRITVADRLALSLRLGEQAAMAYADLHGVSRQEASRLLQRQRQAGRRYSACHTSLLS